VLIILFATSNGYIGTRAMMIGPTKVTLAEKEIASTVMVFSLVVGLTLGVSCGWLIPYIL